MKTLMSTWFACSMAACVMEPFDDGSVVADGQSIIGGTVDDDDPSCVALYAHAPGSPSGSLCSATVIGPRTVLTAAHCVDPRVIGDGQTFEVLTGTTLTGPRLAVVGTAFDPAFDPDNLYGGHDVGVLRLASPTTLPPIPLRRSHTLSNVAVRLCGYGTTTHANTGAGTRRQVTTSLVAANALLMRIGTSNQQNCHGDSGGPAFQVLDGVQTLIGVASFGSDNSETSVCFGGSVYTRVDAVLPFIDGHL